MFAFLLWTYLNAVSAHDKGIVPGVIPITALGLALAVPFLVRAARDGFAFAATALTIALITLTIFLNLYPRVLVSSTEQGLRPDDLVDELDALHAGRDDDRRARC